VVCADYEYQLYMYRQLHPFDYGGALRPSPPYSWVSR
jgi:hypothetical protein